MKKKVINNLTRSLLIGSLLLFLSGSYSIGYRADRYQQADCCEPAVREPACGPTCAPAVPVRVPMPGCARPPVAYTEGCVPTKCCALDARGDPRAMIDCECIALYKEGEHACSIGSTFEYTYVITPKVDVVDVVLKDNVPCGATFVSSEPQATVTGDKLSWHFDSLHAREMQRVTVVMRAETEGFLCNCASITAVPVACTSVFVGKPALEIVKRGPECVCIGDEVTFEIQVTNCGNFGADCVTIRDMVPDGLSHRSGQKELMLDLGTLCPGDTTCAHITLCAERGGCHCNRVQVSAGNCPGKEASACVEVLVPGIAVSKVGTASLCLGRAAAYTITVTNTGTAPLSNIRVVDDVPAGVKVVNAPGASLQGCNAVWMIDCLAPCQSATLCIELCSDCPCVHTNHVNVQGCACNCNVCATDCATTEWLGHAALALEIADVCDPLCLGASTEYIIKVRNQGTAPDGNVRIRVTMPSEIDLVRADGPTGHDVSGKTITFGPIPVLEPGRSLVYRLVGQSMHVGDARVTVELTSDTLRTPLIQQESTQVY